jgi:hypothetical protein
MSYATREEVRGKVEWEGGLTAALDYGLDTGDMPEGDTELREAWDKLATAYKALAPLSRAVDDLLYPAVEASQ